MTKNKEISDVEAKNISNVHKCYMYQELI